MLGSKGALAAEEQVAVGADWGEAAVAEGVAQAWASYFEGLLGVGLGLGIGGGAFVVVV